MAMYAILSYHLQPQRVQITRIYGGSIDLYECKPGVPVNACINLFATLASPAPLEVPSGQMCGFFIPDGEPVSVSLPPEVVIVAPQGAKNPWPPPPSRAASAYTAGLQDFNDRFDALMGFR